MKELSLNILDVAENSVKAGAKNIEIKLAETEETLTVEINDDGCGMKQETLKKVTDPFFTTRTTRNVGLGVPLLKLAAQQTGGNLEITSKAAEDFPNEHGTKIKALFYKKHIDFTPLGDMASTIVTLLQGSEDIDFYYLHQNKEHITELDTKQMRQILGENVALSSAKVLSWVSDYINEE